MGLDVEHGVAVGNAQSDVHLAPFRQFRHQRTRDRADVEIAHADVAQRQHAGADLVAVQRRVMPEVAQAGERRGQPGNRGRRQARALGDFLVAEQQVHAVERPQYFESARQRTDEAAVVFQLAEPVNSSRYDMQVAHKVDGATITSGMAIVFPLLTSANRTAHGAAAERKDSGRQAISGRFLGDSIPPVNTRNGGGQT